MSFLSIVRALIVRIVFFIYCIIAIWRVVATYGNNNLWLMLLLLLGTIIETFVTLYKRSGREWKWFSPAIFFYLATTLPCIWLLELHLMGQRHKELDEITNNTTASDDQSLLGLTIPIDFDDFGWALALEQTMFCILIVSRWVLPRGDISRNQLSQLLLVQVGMAADIMELFEVFEEKKIVDAAYLVYPLLSLWTWSLLQYCLVITNTKARKDRLGAMDEESEAVDGDKVRCTCNIGDWNADIVGILTSTIMQDLPFFIFRIYLIGGIGIISHMMVFFTCKNALVLILQTYRLVVIYMETRNKQDEPEVISNVPTLNNLQEEGGSNRIAPSPQSLNNVNEYENDVQLPNSLRSPKLDEVRRSKNAFEYENENSDKNE